MLDMKQLLPLLIFINCHMIQVSGVLEWTVTGKATDYGQNVTLFCHVPNCCPEDAGWDRWTPQQRTLFIDVKTGRPNKKYDGRIFKNGYTLIIQNLTKDDLNVSYSCLYGVTLGDRKFLQEEDVFTYTSSASRFSDVEIAGITVGVLVVVTIAVLLASFRKHIHLPCRPKDVKGGSGSSNNEDPSIDPEAGQKSEPDCCDGGRGSAISVLTFKNSEVKAESKPDCVNFAEQNESGNVKKTSYDHKDNTRSKDAHEIPNKNEIKEYMDAIQSRYEVRKYVRIQVIGKDGVGKTSLVRRLLNQDCKDVTSTDGIDISRKCHIKESDGTWMFANVETEIEKIGKRILQAVEMKQKGKKPIHDKRRLSDDIFIETEKEKTPNLFKEQRSLAENDESKPLLPNVRDVEESLNTSMKFKMIDTSPGPRSTMNILVASNNNFNDNQSSELDTMNCNTEKPITNTCMDRNSDQITEAMIDKMKEITLYVKNKQETMTDEGLIECGIWDFAGQKEYYPTHQTFLTPHAIYLLVADVRDDLNPIEYDEQFNSDSSGEYIDFWLDSIHCYSENGKNNKSETKGQPIIKAATCTDKASDEEDDYKVKRPPVIMVCTYIDKVSNKEAKKKEFNKNFLTLFGYQEKGNHTDGNIHFISNVESPEDDFTELRAHISNIAEQMDFFGEKLPTRWIQLENTLAVLIDLAGKGKISYCEKYENIEKMAHKISIEKDELLLFLNYQHKIGNIIFFDDKRDYIILQPKWLVNCFKCLIFDDDKNPCTPKELYDLRHKGLLTDNLIDTLFSKVPELLNKNNRTHILDVMEKFDIIVKPKSMKTYYIPCMISQISSLENIKAAFKVENQHCSPWLVVEFQFLPISYYNHILFMYIKEKIVCTEKTSIGDGPPAIYAGKVVVYLDETKQRKLVICFSRNAISLQIWNNNNMGEKEYRKIVAEICKKIEDLETKLDIELHYEIKSKCNTGVYFSSSGRISYKDLIKACVEGNYHCEEHNCMHTTEDIENTWLQTADHMLPLYPEYKSEEKRLKTFNRWPTNKNPTAKDLARAGFFYMTEQGDRTQCFFCAGIICKWDKTDVPIKEHKHLFPSCPFIKKIYNQSHQTTENSKKSD